MSLSPDQHGGNASQSSPEAASSSGQDKSVLSSLNLGFLKSLSEKKTTRDGQTPKRRGPKPDSKPALTRRQELNRQAQRTHRERKELYVKALEEELLRLKETFSNVSQDKERLAEENRKLKDALAQNGIQLPKSAGASDAASNTGPGQQSNATFSGTSFAAGPSNTFSPGQLSHSTAPTVSSPGQSIGHQQMTGQQLQHMTHQQSGGKGGDLEQAGIDFVLTLEKPCMHHIPLLLDRANNEDAPPCGHALMASYPPTDYKNMTESTPFGQMHTHATAEESGPPQGTWELSKADLATLLDLSGKLDLDGEITPVMAWGMVLNHPLVGELEASDFKKVAEELVRKSRCYGFGAVLEEFELRDAMENVIQSRDIDAMVF